MRGKTLTIFAVLAFAALARADEPPPVTVKRVREIVEKAHPILVELTGRKWLEELVVEKADRARLIDALEPGYLRLVRSHHPNRSDRSLEFVVSAMAKSFAEVQRVKYDPAAKRILVSEGAIARLHPEVDPADALTWLVLREVVIAIDHQAVDLLAAFAAAEETDRLRALRMVVQGRAEHFASRVAGILGVSANTGHSLLAISGLRMEMTIVEYGRRFAAALEERKTGLSFAALKNPPVKTSDVFHPERHGVGPEAPDLLLPLKLAAFAERIEEVPEFDLRTAFMKELTNAEVDRAFGGVLGAAVAIGPKGARTMLAAFTDEAGAERFRAALAKLRGPDTTIVTRGAYCGECIGPAEADPARLLEAALRAAVGE